MAQARNLAELEKMINVRIGMALELMQDKIFEILTRQVAAYYDEYMPKKYTRTFRLYEAPKKYPLESNGNTYSFKVGFADEYLTCEYTDGTGLNVLQDFNSKRHGYLDGFDHNYWDEIIDEINNNYGGFGGLFKKKCAEVGINLK